MTDQEKQELNNQINEKYEKGTLEETHFPEVLHSLAMARVTGILTVTREKIVKKIYLRNGFIVFAGSNYIKDRLGNILLQKGVITQTQQQMASQKFQDYDGKVKLGAVLIEMGFVDAKNLANHIRLQITKIIYSLFYWNSGTFSFVEESFSEMDVQLQFTAGDLIISCVRSIKIRDLLVSLLPDKNLYLHTSNSPFLKYQKIRLNSDEKKILDIINGQQKIEDIMNFKHFQKMDVVRTLCGLIYAGLLETSEEPAMVDEIPSFLGDEFDGIITHDFPLQDDSAATTDEPATDKDEGTQVTSGELSVVFLPEFFLEIVNRKQTGLLECTREDVTKVIYFSKGKPVFATSDAPFEQLIPLMVLAEKLNEEQAEKAFKLWEKRQTEWQGTILLELGYLDFDDLEWPFQLQVREIIADLLMWEEGTYQLKEGNLPDSAFVVAELSVPEIIIDCIKRTIDSKVTREKMPQRNSLPRLLIPASDLVEDLPFTAFELEVLKLVDGERTITEITELSHFQENEVMTLFLIFQLLKLVEINEMDDDYITREELQKAITVDIDKDEEETEDDDVEEKVESGAEVSQSRTEVHIAHIQSFHEKIVSIKDPYAILGLNRDAQENQIEVAYHYFIREFHPDKIVSADQVIIQKNQEIISIITESHGKLIGAEERKLVDTMLGETVAEMDLVDEPTSELEAAGDEALKAGDFHEAMKKYQEAHRHFSQRIELLAKIAFIMAFSEGKYRDAKKYCRKAIEKRPNEATYHALMSTICRCSGLRIVAEQAIKQAVSLDPDNTYANEEHRFIKVSVKDMSEQKMLKFIQLLIENL